MWISARNYESKCGTKAFCAHNAKYQCFLELYGRTCDTGNRGVDVGSRSDQALAVPHIATFTA